MQILQAWAGMYSFMQLQMWGVSSLWNGRLLFFIYLLFILLFIYLLVFNVSVNIMTTYHKKVGTESV